MSVLVFDLDGTLVSSMEDLVATLNVVMTSAGHSAIPQDNVANMVGLGAKVLIQRGLEFNGISWTDETVAPLYVHFLEHYAANIAVHTKPFDGVVAALENFRKDGWKLAVCTNKAERLTHPLLATLDLARHFDAVSRRYVFRGQAACRTRAWCHPPGGWRNRRFHHDRRQRHRHRCRP